MGILDTLAARLGYMKAQPPHRYDVAIITKDSDGAPGIACGMSPDEFGRLERDWIGAVNYPLQRAGTYWIMVNGEMVRQGIILSNIVSLTGVLAEKKMAGEE